LPKKDGLNY